VVGLIAEALLMDALPCERVERQSQADPKALLCTGAVDRQPNDAAVGW